MAVAVGPRSSGAALVGEGTRRSTPAPPGQRHPRAGEAEEEEEEGGGGEEEAEEAAALGPPQPAALRPRTTRLMTLLRPDSPRHPAPATAPPSAPSGGRWRFGWRRAEAEAQTRGPAPFPGVLRARVPLARSLARLPSPATASASTPPLRLAP